MYEPVRRHSGGASAKFKSFQFLVGNRRNFHAMRASREISIVKTERPRVFLYFSSLQGSMSCEGEVA